MSYKEELETIKVQLKEGILEAVFNVIQDVNFSESKTFSKKVLAEAWIKKRESEIELRTVS